MKSITFLSLAFEFSIQTMFLLTPLWLLIKVQKLKYNLLGLLGSAVLTSSLGMVLDHFIGANFSTLIAAAALILCLSQAIHAEHAAVGFTAAISYAVMVGLNFWLLGMLMGGMKVSARWNRQPAEVAATGVTNNTGRVSVLVGTNAPAISPEEAARKLRLEIAGNFSLKGITQSATLPMAMIYSGTKSYTMSPGEVLTAETAKGKVIVICKEIGDDKVAMNIGGEELTLTFRSGTKAPPAQPARGNPTPGASGRN